MTLESNQVDAKVPDRITIAEGASSGTFTIETRGVSTPTEAWITATVNRDTRAVQIRIVPAALGPLTGTVRIGGGVE